MTCHRSFHQAFASAGRASPARPCPWLALDSLHPRRKHAFPSPFRAQAAPQQAGLGGMPALGIDRPGPRSTRPLPKSCPPPRAHTSALTSPCPSTWLRPGPADTARAAGPAGPVRAVRGQQRPVRPCRGLHGPHLRGRDPRHPPGPDRLQPGRARAAAGRDLGPPPEMPPQAPPQAPPRNRPRRPQAPNPRHRPRPRQPPSPCPAGASPKP